MHEIKVFGYGKEAGMRRKSMGIEKVLILRFSSLGDVTQSLCLPPLIKMGLNKRNKRLNRDKSLSKNPEGSNRREEGTEGEAQEEVVVHFATRKDFGELFDGNPHVDRLWTLDREGGIRALIQLVTLLRQEKFTRIYDAHNSLRSRFLVWCLRLPLGPRLSRPILVRKHQKRWKRFLLFYFRINLFTRPFSGQRDLMEPLNSWGIASKDLVPPPLLFPSPLFQKRAQLLLEREFQTDEGLPPFVALAPSAAYPLKRWPLSYWQDLIAMNPELRFVILGGPGDDFLRDLVPPLPLPASPESQMPSESSRGGTAFFPRVVNVAGKTSLMETAAIIAQSQALISNDTGVLHMGEQLGHPLIALMGPAPFGFPSRLGTSQIMELSLPCRPCSKHGQGECWFSPESEDHHQCLRGIHPLWVHRVLRDLLLMGKPGRVNSL